MLNVVSFALVLFYYTVIVIGEVKQDVSFVLFLLFLVSFFSL